MSGDCVSLIVNFPEMVRKAINSAAWITAEAASAPLRSRLLISVR
jgi:hypothetical protein